MTRRWRIHLCLGHGMGAPWRFYLRTPWHDITIALVPASKLQGYDRTTKRYTDHYGWYTVIPREP